jgi:hypothetical protein
LPPAVRSEDRLVVITRFPVAPARAPSVARASGPAAPAAPTASAPQPASPAGRPQTIGAFVDVTIQAISDGRFGDVPREA